MVSSVLPGPDLAVSKSTNGTYQQGGTGTFSVTVSNVGGSPSTGTVAVTELPPAGMIVTSMSGDGWAFNSNNITCTRPDSLGTGTNYPPITVGVTIATNTPAEVTNSVVLSGGGDISNANNTAQARVAVSPLLSPIESWRLTHFGTTENTGNAADTSILAADGLANLLKYAMGLPPTNTASAADLPLLERSTSLAIRFRRARAATDVTMHVEASGALSSGWTGIWSSATNAYGGGTNDFENVTVFDIVPMSEAAQRYLRLKVTRP